MVSYEICCSVLLTMVKNSGVRFYLNSENKPFKLVTNNFKQFGMIFAQFKVFFS